MTQYLKSDKVLTALATILLIILGWLFTVVINSNQHLRDRQEMLAERVAKMEQQIEDFKGRKF